MPCRPPATVDRPSSQWGLAVTAPQFSRARIFVLDDRQENIELLEQLLKGWGYEDIVATTDSATALESCIGCQPDLILLDLQMPPPNGFDVMRALAEQVDDGSFLPILVLTADLSDDVRERALALGAKDFLSKPFNFNEIRLRVANLLETRRLHLALRDQNDTLDRRVRDRTRLLHVAREELLDRLSLAAEYRDDATNQHAKRVGRTAALLARELGLPDARVELIRRAAPLHDIGKIGIPDGILLKPGKLTPSEVVTMRGHAALGAKILGGSEAPVLQQAEEIAISHHERWNGEGYPGRLAGEAIPLAGRLVALADVFDALTHERPYKEAMPVALAVTAIEALSANHLDPRVVDAFLVDGGWCSPLRV
jgi:putative two-component system response regulator